MNKKFPPNKRRRVDGNNAGPSTFSYWPESPEAYLLFKPRREFVSVFDSAQNATTSTTMEYIETPQEALERRILQLKAVHESENSWRCVVQGGDPDNYCTKTEIYEIRQRSLFLILAYQLALQHMNKWTWHECCRDACKTLNGLGLNQATFYKTVAQWNMGFRELECFPHPNLYVQCGKRPLPRLLEIYPDAKEQILSFGMKNLAKLTIESVRDFIVSTVIPRLALQWQQDEEAGAASADQQGTGIDSTSTITTTRTSHTEENQTASRTLINSFLHAYGLKTLSFSTAWRWMKRLGFEFDDRKKSFYVDGHEREDVVANRKQFCTTYLTKLEPYCKRWIQIPINDAIGMANVDVEMGHRYFDIVKDTEHIEYHVDYWNRFGGGTDVINPTTSIRVSSNARPIMIIGQDESVFPSI
ncbi:hypothetical protein MHU86_20819 [Fragilaria crotonensis]|nr:hypothetical protein MHU86_20819 [Fragilaria crotonensis]